MKVTRHSAENTFLSGNSATRVVASGRELEPPTSLVTCQQGNRAGPLALLPPNRCQLEHRAGYERSYHMRSLSGGMQDCSCRKFKWERGNVVVFHFNMLKRMSLS